MTIVVFPRRLPRQKHIFSRPESGKNSFSGYPGPSPGSGRTRSETPASGRKRAPFLPSFPPRRRTGPDPPAAQIPPKAPGTSSDTGGPVHAIGQIPGHILHDPEDRVHQRMNMPALSAPFKVSGSMAARETADIRITAMLPAFIFTNHFRRMPVAYLRAFSYCSRYRSRYAL